jgi:hypothetical protein
MCWAARVRHGAVCNREVPQRESEDLSRLHRRAGGSGAVHRQKSGRRADTYLRISKAKVDRELLLKIIKNPQVNFSVAPQNTYGLAQFLYRVGAIKKQPASWRDYFEDPVIAAGS